MKSKRLYLLVLTVVLALLALSSGSSFADGTIAYVSAAGSDTTGDGSLAKPYASLSKAFSALPSGGTIALLTDITMSNDTRLICTNSNTYVFTSAHGDGTLVDNAAGDYTDVRTVHRGSTTYSMMCVTTGTFTAKQIIFDGGNTAFVANMDDSSVNGGNPTGGYILHMPGNTTTTASFTLSSNAIFQNNRSTGDLSGGEPGDWAGGVVLGVLIGTKTNPQLILEKNAQICGCIAPRAGGAITAYTGAVYIKDDASIHHNGIEFRDNYLLKYIGGGAILAYNSSTVHLSGKAEIRDNYVDMGGCDKAVLNGLKANAVQISGSAKIYVSGSVRIFRNVVKNCQNAFGLQDNEQANVFDAVGGSLIVEGAMGTNAKIGVCSKTNVVANGSGYTVTASDAEAFFDDTGKRTVLKHVSGNQLVLSDTIIDVKLKLAGDDAWKKFTGTLSQAITGLSQNDITVFVDGVRQTSGYAVQISGAAFTVTFDNAIVGKKFAASISKNGYKVTDKGDGTGTTVVILEPLSAPVLNDASDITATGFTASWSAVAGAESYRLDVATDAAFGNMVAGYSNLTVSGTSLNVTGLSKDTAYSFRVRACSTTAGSSLNSGAKSATTLADASVSIAPTAKTITYDGNNQLPVTEGTAQNGFMEYVLGTATAPGTNWSTDVPQVKNAGTVYVWYRAATADSDKGCSSGTPACVPVTIHQATLTIQSADIAYRAEGGVCTANVESAVLGPFVSEDMLTLGTDFTATAALDDPDYDRATKVTVTVTLLNTAAAANYQMAGSKDLPKESAPLAKPVVTPQTAAVYPGQSAVFTVTAEPVSGLSYQWYVDRNTGSFARLDGETSATCTTPETAPENDGYRYRCEVTDAFRRTVVSNDAALHVVKEEPVPVTGDGRTIVMWCGMALLGLAGFAVLKRRRVR